MRLDSLVAVGIPLIEQAIRYNALLGRGRVYVFSDLAGAGSITFQCEWPTKSEKT
jgi:hypothetical protein